MNKKANLTDFLTAGGIFLGLVLVCFIMYSILDGFSTGISQTDISNQTGTDFTTFIDASNTKMSKSVDWGILFMAIGFIIFSYVAASKIPADNKAIIILMLFIFIFFIIAMVISNVYGAFMSKASFSNFVYLNMPITHVLLRYFPFYALIYTFIVLVGFFGKREGVL